MFDEIIYGLANKRLESRVIGICDWSGEVIHSQLQTSLPAYNQEMTGESEQEKAIDERKTNRCKPAD